MMRLFVLLTAVVCCYAACRKEMVPTQDTTDSPQGCPDSDGNLHELDSEWSNGYETCVCGNCGIICCKSFEGYGPYGHDRYRDYGPYGQYGGYRPYGRFGDYWPFGQGHEGYRPSEPTEYYERFGGNRPIQQFGDYWPFGQGHEGYRPSEPTENYERGHEGYRPSEPTENYERFGDYWPFVQGHEGYRPSEPTENYDRFGDYWPFGLHDNEDTTTEPIADVADDDMFDNYEPVK